MSGRRHLDNPCSICGQDNDNNWSGDMACWEADRAKCADWWDSKGDKRRQHKRARRKAEQLPEDIGKFLGRLYRG